MLFKSYLRKILNLFQNPSVKFRKPEVKASGLQHMREQISVKSMFAAASYQFTRSVGRNTLHPVPSIDEQDNVKPFQLVVKTKKRKFIFFEKANFSPTEFQLTDVMVDTTPMKTEPVESQLMSDFNRTAKLSLKGKFGAQLSKEIVDVELEASDTISLNIKFGKITKYEVKEPELLTELSKRNINMDHPYIRQIQMDSHKSLCLITGVAFLKDGGSIHRESDVDADASVKASLIKEASASTGFSSTRGRDLGLSPLTPVAYNIHELNVDKRTGAMELLLAKGRYGGFRDSIGYDEVDAIPGNLATQDAGSEVRKQIENDLDHPKKVFAPLFRLPDKMRTQLNSWLLQLMSVARDMVILSDLLDDVSKGQQLHIKLDDLKGKFLSSDDIWLEVLKFVGFQIKEGHLSHISKPSPMLYALEEYFDAASMLDDDMFDLLKEFKPQSANALLTVLQEGVKGNAVSDQSIVQACLEDSACIKILLDLQYSVQGRYGGFRDSIGYDEVDAIPGNLATQDAGSEVRKQIEIDLDHPKKVFAPLFRLPDKMRTQLNSWLLQLMSVARDMVILSDLLDDVSKGQQLHVKLDDLKGKFLSSDDIWLEVLKFVGFQIKEGHLSHISKPSPMLYALEEYFDAASMLDDDMFDLLKEFKPQSANALLTVLQEGVKGNAVSDPSIVQACLEDSACIKILLDLQYSVQGESFQAPAHLENIIDEVYWVIYALYGNERSRK